MTFSVGDRVTVMGDCDTPMPAERWVEGTVLSFEQHSRWVLIACDSLPLSRGAGPGEWWCTEGLLRLVDQTPEYLEARRQENIRRVVNRPPAKRYGPYKPIMRALP